MGFWTDEKKAALIAMLADGWSMGKCAADLGCSRSAVSGRIDREGLRGNGPCSTRRPAHALVRRDPRPPSGRMRRYPGLALECVSLDIPFFERRSNQCSWVTGTGEDARAVFCGCEIHANSWCIYHDKLGRRQTDRSPSYSSSNSAAYLTRNDNILVAP